MIGFFSSPEIIIECIENNFINFLDKTLYISINENRCSHILYGNNMFMHHNPLHNITHYEYYSRCVDRFKKLLQCKEYKLFIIFFPNNKNNDEQKENYKNIIIKFNKNFSKYVSNYTLLSIYHIQQLKQYNIIKKENNIDFLELHTLSLNNGKKFKLKTDNKYFNNIITNIKHANNCIKLGRIFF